MLDIMWILEKIYGCAHLRKTIFIMLCKIKVHKKPLACYKICLYKYKSIDMQINMGIEINIATEIYVDIAIHLDVYYWYPVHNFRNSIKLHAPSLLTLYGFTNSMWLSNRASLFTLDPLFSLQWHSSVPI